MSLVDGVIGAYHHHRDWLRPRARVVRPALRTVSFDPRGRAARGNVLISYMTEAFDVHDGQLPYTHTNLWECRQMVRSFLDLGFHVDVVNFRNFLFTPHRTYDFFVDSRTNMERLASVLGDGCTKIQHIETSHLLFQNAAEYRRLLDVQRRRGVTLQPRRVERRINRCIEHADCAVLYGGDHSARTWQYAGKPMYQVPGTPVREFGEPSGKDFDRVRHNFLWMGSNGFVLRGLDLVLEAFAGMPDHHLTVCGPLEDEPDFVEAFHRELFDTPNITARGWVDVRGASFEALLRNAVGLVYPSASESRSGSVLTSLHAGLIPIVTPESGVEVDDSFGTVLTEPTVESIQAAVLEIAQRPTAELEQMALTAWKFARSTHSHARFASSYRAIIEGLLGEGPMPAPFTPSPR
jgi:hypothetical protein